MNRQTLLEIIRQETESFDEKLHLMRIPLTATYHTALKSDETPEVYGLLASAVHAFHLLEAGDSPGIARANQILERVVPLQDRDPASETYGIWSYFYEEPLAEMDRPDWNMADFHGKRLIVTLIKHEEKLASGVAAMLREAIEHACRAIIKRNVGPHYTNIAIMGAFVTLVGGELLGNAEFRNYGLARIKRFYDFTTAIGTFSEYNSPCYTPIAIKELHSLSTYSENAEAVAYADELMNLAWRMAGEHYHAGTGAWGGPHSRTYSSLLRPDERAFLEEAMMDETFEFGENIRCPKEYRPLFSASDTRSFTVPTLLEEQAGYQVYATLYRDEVLSLGSFSKGVMWNQRRNLIAYLKDNMRTCYVQLQFLKDGDDFCSAMFAGAQAGTDVLFGLNLLTDNGAWHSDLDIINGRFKSSDLRIRFKIGGVPEEKAREVRVEGGRIDVQFGEYTLAVQSLVELSDYGDLKIHVGYEADCAQDASETEIGHSNGSALYLDYVLYSGVERAFDFHQVKEAAWLFQLGFLRDGRALPEVALENNDEHIEASTVVDGRQIAVEIPVAPGRTTERFLSNRVRLP